MLYNYKGANINTPANDNVEAYFKNEGLDRLYILSLIEKEEKQKRAEKIRKFKMFLISAYRQLVVMEK